MTSDSLCLSNDAARLAGDVTVERNVTQGRCGSTWALSTGAMSAASAVGEGPPELIDIAVRDYSEYPDEVDRWIDHVDEEARRAQQIWERRQDALA